MAGILIYGAGGLGRVVLDIVRLQRRWPVLAFLDSDPALAGTAVEGVPVRGAIEVVQRCCDEGATHAIVAIGGNETRCLLAAELRRRGLSLASAIHPTATIAHSARLSEHVIVGPRAAICVHATVGPHSVVSSANIVDHDCQVGVGVFLESAARLAGGVVVEDRARIGVGAAVIPQKRVGAHAFVAPGSVVIRDVPAGEAVRGVPARRIALHGQTSPTSA